MCFTQHDLFATYYQGSSEVSFIHLNINNLSKSLHPLFICKSTPLGVDTLSTHTVEIPWNELTMRTLGIIWHWRVIAYFSWSTIDRYWFHGACQISFFKYSHKKKSKTARSGDLEGQTMPPNLLMTRPEKWPRSYNRRVSWSCGNAKWTL